MARITVEDCLNNVANRFELVMVASKRARQLEMENDSPKVPPENDKATVIALREIAAGKITASILDEAENIRPVNRSMHEQFDSGDTIEAI